MTTYFHYDNWNVVAESDSSGTTVATYSYDNRNQLVSMTRGGNTYYYQYNAHDDVTSLTNSSGQVVNIYAYDPWGKILTANETVENPYRYAGYRYDSETELYYLQHRYYDPGICRFLTKDLNAGDTKIPQTQNLYTYCNNNPTTHVDPKGLWAATRHKTWSKYAAKAMGFELWRQIGDASYIIDFSYPATNPDYTYIHFDVPLGGSDSRIEFANWCMQMAIMCARRNDPTYAQYLGYGLHAVQDYFGHLDLLPPEHIEEGGKRMCGDPNYLPWRKKAAVSINYGYLRQFLNILADEELMK